jgi:hypothetical protein
MEVSEQLDALDQLVSRAYGVWVLDHVWTQVHQLILVPANNVADLIDASFC